MHARPLQEPPEPVPAVAPANATRKCGCLKYAVGLGALGVALLSVPGSASGQLSATITVVSDYRYRGITLSDNEPAAQLGVAYDDAQGFYAGAFVSTVESSTYGTTGVQAISFAGYAWRNASGLSLEVGADYSVVTAAPRFDYYEVYAGFAFENLSGRVYYSPRYFGQDSPAVYGELNAAPPLLENVRILAHVGILGSNAKPPYGQRSSPVIDFAAGAGIEWQGFNLQAAWAGVNQFGAAYQVTGTGRKTGPVVSISRSF